MNQTIPSVSLRDFTEGDQKARLRFVDTIGNALSELGFFALSDHGVSSELIREAYSEVTTFFELPESEKKRFEDLKLNGQRGFTSFGREHAKDSNAPDLKEYWHTGRELSTDHPLYGEYPKNIWPDHRPEFRSVMLELFEALDTCSMHLLDACSLYLGEEQSLLRSMAVDGNTILRAIHYPPVPEDRPANAIRAAAHEDINFITLLCESTADGLELLQRDGKWRPIRSLEGQIIVDSGDMLQNLTNGVLKSTTHRVVNPDNSKDRRFSMPFFVHPRSEVDLSPLSKCVDRVGKQEYPNLTAGEYLEKRLSEIGLSSK